MRINRTNPYAEWKSKRFTRIYLYIDRFSIMLANSCGGQLKGHFRIGVFWTEFWKRGIRFLWIIKPESDASSKTGDSSSKTAPAISQ